MPADNHSVPGVGQQHVWSQTVNFVLYYRLQTDVSWISERRNSALLWGQTAPSVTVQSLGIRKAKLTDGKYNK